jgi:hypothetical protein
MQSELYKDSLDIFLVECNVCGLLVEFLFSCYLNDWVGWCFHIADTCMSSPEQQGLPRCPAECRSVDEACEVSFRGV